MKNNDLILKNDKITAEPESKFVPSVAAYGDKIISFYVGCYVPSICSV